MVYHKNCHTIETATLINLLVTPRILMQVLYKGMNELMAWSIILELLDL